jgi:hypothetical protein
MLKSNVSEYARIFRVFAHFEQTLLFVRAQRAQIFVAFLLRELEILVQQNLLVDKLIKEPFLRYTVQISFDLNNKQIVE